MVKKYIGKTGIPFFTQQFDQQQFAGYKWSSTLYFAGALIRISDNSDNTEETLELGGV